MLPSDSNIISTFVDPVIRTSVAPVNFTSSIPYANPVSPIPYAIPVAVTPITMRIQCVIILIAASGG